jgi:HK97 family phage portal protein
MPLFQSIRNAVRIPGDSISQPSGWIARLLSLSQTASGIVINENNALTVSDVYKCNRVIGETIAMLPWKVYRRKDRGREEARRHPLYRLLHDAPNDHMTSFTFREYLSSCMELRGRFFAYIERNEMARPVALWPLRPDLTRLDVRDGVMWFVSRTQGGAEVRFWDDEILYIPGLTRDGYNTYSPIDLHRESLGLSKATEVFGAAFFGNGAHNSGFLKHPAKLSEPAQARLVKSFEGGNQGPANAHKLKVLEEGMDFVANTIPPDQAQFLQTRQFQRGEVAGIFRVPPHKIGDLSRSTNNNIEHQDLEFLRDSIAPRLARIEQACNRRLLLPREQETYYIEFEIKGMMRGDTAARAAWNNAMFNTGAYSPNMILESENQEPVEGGDEHFVPMNMVPLSLAAKAQVDPELSPEGDPLQRARQANLRFFRDAAGRVVNRKAADRVLYAETAFLQPVCNVIECVLGSISDEMKEFAAEYAGKIGAKSPDWATETVGDTSAAELDLCIEAVLSKGAK